METRAPDADIIAFVLPNMAYGGAERIALRLIRSFASRGHTVDLVLMQKSGELLEQLPPQVRIFDLGAFEYAGPLSRSLAI